MASLTNLFTLDPKLTHTKKKREKKRKLRINHVMCSYEYAEGEPISTRVLQSYFKIFKRERFF